MQTPYGPLVHRHGRGVADSLRTAHRRWAGYGGTMSEPRNTAGSAAEGGQSQRVAIVGPDGSPRGAAPYPAEDESAEQQDSVANYVEEPAKVMRIGTMIKQLLDEVRAAPLDEASRDRLRAIHEKSLNELDQALAPELRD